MGIPFDAATLRSTQLAMIASGGPVAQCENSGWSGGRLTPFSRRLTGRTTLDREAGEGQDYFKYDNTEDGLGVVFIFSLKYGCYGGQR